MKKYYVALSAAALLWSGNFIVGRLLRDEVTPVTLNFLRWGIALAVLAALGWRELAQARAVLAREWKLVAGAGATGIAAFHTCVYFALQETAALNALLLLATAPVAIMLLSWLAAGTGFPARQKAGAAVSLAGAAWLILRGEPAALLGLQASSGDLWMLAAVAIWAVYSVLLQRRPKDLAPGVLLTGSVAAGLAWMAPLYALELSRGAGGLPVSLPGLGGLAYVALGASVLAFHLWSHGVAAIGASRAGQFIHLMPLFGAVLSLAFLGERIEAFHLAGAALVFAGIALAQPPQLSPSPRCLPEAHSAMASIRKEFELAVPPEGVWAAFKDVGAVHTRLAKGFVADCRMDGADRIVTFANGLVAREVIVDVDDKARRIAYSARSDRLAHHNASFQVLDQGNGRTKVVWIADVLPHEAAKAVGAMMEEGVRAMSETLAGLKQNVTPA